MKPIFYLNEFMNSLKKFLKYQNFGWYRKLILDKINKNKTLKGQGFSLIIFTIVKKLLLLSYFYELFVIKDF